MILRARFVRLFILASVTTVVLLGSAYVVTAQRASVLAPSSTGYLIDDGGPGFEPPGPFPPAPTGWSHFPGGGYGGACIYTPQDGTGHTVKWKPDLDAGWYKVYVHYWANQDAQTDRARYTIRHKYGTKTVYVNQKLDYLGNLVPAPGGNSGWVLLGIYYFDRGVPASQYVELNDGPAQPAPVPNVVADAVWFAPLEVWVDDNYASDLGNDGHLWGVTAFSAITDGLKAVAEGGTVHIGPNEPFLPYREYITVTKSITLTGAGPDLTVIQVNGGYAVGIGANNVTLSNMTIQANPWAVPGPDVGIANFDGSTWPNITGFKIDNCKIHGFNQHGIHIKEASGQIGVSAGNVITGNELVGIYIENPSPPAVVPGPVVIANNTLGYASGSLKNHDSHIRLDNPITGTVVRNNVINGSNGAVGNEAGILIYDWAYDLTLEDNTFNRATIGISMTQVTPNIVQNTKMYSNTFIAATTGTPTGIRMYRAPATATGAHTTILGGSVTAANRFRGFQGSQRALYLQNYSRDITATINDWGVCNLRDIEDEIRHNYDSAALGLVTYEPALCVPATLQLTADPSTLPADGTSLSTLRATVWDGAGQLVPDGTFVGFTSTMGSTIFGYAEENDPGVTLAGPGWALVPDGSASGGQYAATNNVGDTATWSFTGTAFSVIYLKSVAGGTASVYLNTSPSPIATIDMNTSGPIEYKVERVLTNTLASGRYTVTVQCTSGWIFIDAFRSGTTTAGGRATTLLTAASTPGTGEVWATAPNGRIITALTTLPGVVTGTAAITFQGADTAITKTLLSPTTAVRPNGLVTFTVEYHNLGPAAATGVRVTDTLPITGLLFVTSTSTPNVGYPTPASPQDHVWNVGTVNPSARGWITLTTRVDPSVPWPLSWGLTNTASIGSRTNDPVGGNNQMGVTLTVIPGLPAAITLTSQYTGVLVHNQDCLITATVRDAWGNAVANGTPVNFNTTLGGLPTNPTTSATTTDGQAVVTLRSGDVAGTATVWGIAAAGVVDDVQVKFLPLEAYTVTVTAAPEVISVGGERSTIRAHVTDIYRNNVMDGLLVTFTTTLGGFPPPTTTISATTMDGNAIVALTSGEAPGTAIITATTENGRMGDTTVTFRAGMAYTVSVAVAGPSPVPLCGAQRVVTVTATDRFGSPVPDGTNIFFNVEMGGQGSFDPSIVPTVGGVATSTLTTGGVLGAGFLRVVVYAADSAASGSATVALVQGPPHHINTYIDAPTITVRDTGLNSYTSIQAIVEDCGNNRLPAGLTVTYRTSGLGGAFLESGTNIYTTTTSAGGVALATYRSDVQPGLAPITITCGPATKVVTITVDPGPPAYIDSTVLPTTIRNCGGTATLSAVIVDKWLNRVKNGTLATFSANKNLVSFSPTQMGTINGMVTTTVRSRNEILPHIPETEQVVVQSGGQIGPANLDIIAGVPFSVTITTTPDSVPILGHDMTVNARVQDCAGNPVDDGTAVQFQTDKGLFLTGSRFYDATTTGGVATATLRSGDIAGTVHLTATVNSVIGTASAYFIPGPPYYVDVAAYPPNIPADGLAVSTVSALVQDEKGNTVENGTRIGFTTNFGTWVESGTTAYTSTTTSGIAIAHLRADVVPHIAVVWARAENGRGNFTYVTFQAALKVYMPLIMKNNTR